MIGSKANSEFGFPLILNLLPSFSQRRVFWKQNSLFLLGPVIACVASVSVRFGSKELQRENGASERGGRGRKGGNTCRQTRGF